MALGPEFSLNFKFVLMALDPSIDPQQVQVQIHVAAIRTAKMQDRRNNDECTMGDKCSITMLLH